MVNILLIPLKLSDLLGFNFVSITTLKNNFIRRAD